MYDIVRFSRRFRQLTYVDATELTGNFVVVAIASPNAENGKSEGDIEELPKLRDAALQPGVSFPTIKQ
jgi:hypothetical protein